MKIFEWLTTKLYALSALFLVRRGSAMAGKVIGIAIAIFVLSAILPSAMTTFFAVNTTTWDDNVATLWDLIPIGVVLGVVLGFFYIKGGKK